MSFNLCGSFSRWCGVQSNRVLHTRPVSAKNQQAQEAQVFPQQHFSRGVSGLLPWHSVPLLLQAVAAVAADGGVSNKSLSFQHFVRDLPVSRLADRDPRTAGWKGPPIVGIVGKLKLVSVVVKTS